MVIFASLMSSRIRAIKATHKIGIIYKNNILLTSELV